MLAHHAAAAGDVPRILRYAPAAAAEASRSGAHREAVAFYETALHHVGADTATRAALLEAMSVDLYLADRLRDAIAAQEQALELRRGMGEVVGVGLAHTALSGFAWDAADRARAERHIEAAIEILSGTDDRRALGFALARHAFLAAWRGDAAEARRSGDQAVRIADELGDDVVLRSTASIGVAVARLLEGDLGGAGRPARGHRGRPGAPARRPDDDTDDQPVPLRRRAGPPRRGGGVARPRDAHERGARHPELLGVAARGAGAAAAAAGPLGRGRAGRPRRAPVR